MKRYSNQEYHPVVTNPVCPNDGFGVNFKYLIYSVMYAELNNCKFVYSPFTELQHNYDNDPDYIVKKEELINFIGNFELANNNDVYILDNYSLLRFFYFNINMCANSLSLKKIKHLFYINKTNPFNNTSINIAIHIRKTNKHDYSIQLYNDNILSRTDKSYDLVDLKIKNKEFQIPGLDVPDSLYVTIINQFEDAFKDRDIKFHIFSQGDVEDFKFITNKNVILHINENLEDTFKQMVFADILVTAPSNLSYTAAMLSNNQIYYIDYCDKPLPSWNIVQNYKNSRDHDFDLYHNIVDIKGNIVNDEITKNYVTYNVETDTFTITNRNVSYFCS